MSYVIRFSEGSAEHEVWAPTYESAIEIAKSLKEASAADVSVWTVAGDPISIEAAHLNPAS